MPSAFELEAVAMVVPVEMPSFWEEDAKLALSEISTSVILIVRLSVTVLVPSLAVRVNE